MKNTPGTILGAAIALAIATFVAVAASQNQPPRRSAPAAVEAAVLARLGDVQKAAEALDPEKVFSYVLENDAGALAQNGRLLLTRQEALDATRQGFRGLEKVGYRFHQQHVSLLSPTVALAVGEGESSASTSDGRTFTTRFVQSVVLVLTNGQWNVFHSHRSFPPR